MEMNLDTFGHLDKVFSKNLTVFNNQDNALLHNLVVYLGWQWANDPFNFGEIDPKKFEKVMGYKSRKIFTDFADNIYQEQHLNLTQEQIEELKKSDDPNQHYWNTKFENALYTLATKNFELSEGYEMNDGEKEHTLTSYQILKKVTIQWKKAKGGQMQKTYYFEANKDFLFNLTKYFALIDKDVYIKFRKSNLQSLYNYLCDIRHDKKVYNTPTASITPYYNFLKKLTGVNISDQKVSKKKIRAKLNKVLTEATHLHGTVVWGKQKPSDRGTYQPIITFDYTKDIESKNIMEKTLIVLFFHSLLDLYRNTYDTSSIHGTEEEKTYFWKWCCNQDIDRHEKLMKMNTIYFNFYDKVKQKVKVEGNSNNMNFHYNKIVDYLDNLDKHFRFKTQ